MPYELPAGPDTERRTRLARWLTFTFAAILVVLVAYLGYVGYEASRQLTGAPSPSTDCRTPESLGWTYEAINYDIAGDADLVDEPNPEACTTTGPRAGADVTGPGRIGIAGWYVPAATNAGPDGPTVVLVHGWGSNKSNLLSRAELLHAAYNVVLLDLRNHGQSGEAPTTQGVLEAGDVRAVIDWLEEEKGPAQIAVFGVSMGGATALREAATDDRVDALVVESTHATIANAIEARLERAGYPLSVPAAWAALLGALLRTGEDVTVADPIRSVERLDGRPLLLISGGLDDTIGDTDADDLLAAAQAGDAPASLHVCPDAGHADAVTVCAEDYRDWVLGFLERHLGPPG
jgi:pimeloyl-ACP methyl ester carboxylesterase